MIKYLKKKWYAVPTVYKGFLFVGLLMLIITLIELFI